MAAVAVIAALVVAVSLGLFAVGVLGSTEATVLAMLAGVVRAGSILFGPDARTVTENPAPQCGYKFVDDPR